MCGITGIYNLKKRPVDLMLVQKMTNTLQHRGPDDSGVYVNENIGLGHRRLSVIDLSSLGHQPMSNEDKTIWIVYNGEIYNFQELRKILKNLGYKFKSKTDTEVILYSYQQWGEDCLEKFNGMFVFAIWDRKKQQLFLARDRLGQKPLYYYIDKNKFVFSSEIKAILEDNSIKRRIGHQGMIDYFTFGHSIAPDTIYQGIKKLLPGHYLIFKDRKFKIKKYWELSFDKGKNNIQNYYKEKVKASFKRAVSQRLVSDLPLGVFLSGGIDSSAIVAMMANLGVSPIKTFSVGFNVKGNEFNELSDARIVANYFKTEHYELMLGELDLINTLDKMVYHFDEPFGDAANLPVFYMSQFAKKYVTVALSGDGADEIFGGYRRYIIEKVFSKFMFLNLLSGNNSIKKISSSLPKFRRIKKIMEASIIEDQLLRYTNWLTFFSKDMRDQLFSATYNQDPLMVYKKYFSDSKSQNLVEKFMELDQRILLPDDYLEKIDKSSMAVGLEVRTPFLDYRLVELANSIPLEYKIKGIKTKFIFKEAVSDILPKQILKKRKHGFAVPTNDWFKGKLKDYLFEVIFDKKTKSRKYFNYNYIEKLYKNYQEKNQPFSSQLWLILNFELWHRRFIDKN